MRRMETNLESCCAGRLVSGDHLAVLAVVGDLEGHLGDTIGRNVHLLKEFLAKAMEAENLMSIGSIHVLMRDKCKL